MSKKDTLIKVKTSGFIVLMGIILSVLGVMSVLLMPVVWLYQSKQDLLQKQKDYIDSREKDVPNYLSGKSTKKTLNDKKNT
jgi:hypothetical protein